MPGIIGRKIGMTSVFGPDGQNIACTVIEAGPCPVVTVRTQAADGYEAVQLAFEPVRDRKLSKGELGHLAKAPYAKRHKDGRIILTLLSSKRCRHLARDNRCKVYDHRPHACSEFPMGSECCIFAREDVLDLHDGVPPEDRS